METVVIPPRLDPFHQNLVRELSWLVWYLRQSPQSQGIMEL